MHFKFTAVQLLVVCAASLGPSGKFLAPANASGPGIQDLFQVGVFNPGDLVEVKRGFRTWRGRVLESLGSDDYRVQFETETSTEIQRVSARSLTLVTAGARSRAAQVSRSSRTWVTADWNHALEGEFVRRDGPQVVVRTSAGELFGIPFEQLSPSDQQFVESAGNRPTAASSPGQNPSHESSPSAARPSTLDAIPTLAEFQPATTGERPPDNWVVTPQKVAERQPTFSQVNLKPYGFKPRSKLQFSAEVSGNLNCVIATIESGADKRTEIQAIDLAGQHHASKIVEDNSSFVTDVSWSGTYFVTGARGPRPRTVWRFSDGQLEPVANLPGARSCLTIARDRWLIIDNFLGQLQIVDLLDLSPVALFETTRGSLAGLSPAENYLAFEAPDGGAIVDLNTMAIVQRIPLRAATNSEAPPFRSFAFSLDESVLASQIHQEVDLWRWRDGTKLRSFPLDGDSRYAKSLKFLRDDLLLVNQGALVDIQLGRPVWLIHETLWGFWQPSFKHPWQASIVQGRISRTSQPAVVQLVPLIHEQLDALRQRASSNAGPEGIPVLGITTIHDEEVEVNVN